MSLLPS